MIRITDIQLPLDYSDEDILDAACKALRVERGSIKSVSLFRRSTDARRKSDIHFTATVDVRLNSDERRAVSRAKNAKAQVTQPYRYDQPVASGTAVNPPVVVGAGPAGLFASLILARAGLRPILIERGCNVDARAEDVRRFWENSQLDAESNVQFGEGGAGAFSDGKLNTGTKDPRARFVLTELASHGAPQEILYCAKPHVGTDKLKPTVKNLREELVSLGATVLFRTKLKKICSKSGRVCAICVERGGKTDVIETKSLVLAIGHSARDTFEMLFNEGIALAAKPFSVGVRIEHLQEKINRSQYGALAGSARLGAADYKMNIRTADGRGVYTFCMCPGGYVVAAASEENSVATNGMSEFSRNGANANAGLLVGVEPKDFASDSPLAGVSFQRSIERAAFIAGSASYKAPVQRVGDFLRSCKSKRFGSVLPTYRPGTEFALMEEVFPTFVTDSLRFALTEMDKKLSGFADGDALLTGAETRSSSPVRILRGEDFQSLSLRGLFPCGEGAGYAGGIVSAAVDGIRCAEAVISDY